MTQPVYDPDVLDRFLRDTEHLEMPVLVGLLPLASWRNAEFLHNEVPGMAVPEDIRARMKEAGSGPSARAEGVKIAQETLMEIKDRVVGAYIMPPFGRYVAALEILSCIDGYTVPE
jgi:homocysteine S-methyltransferase